MTLSLQFMDTRLVPSATFSGQPNLPSIHRGESIPEKTGLKFLPHSAHCAQDLQFFATHHTIRNRNRPAKQVGNQRWLNLHSLNRGSTRQSVLCAVSASPECLMNRGELHRLRTGSPAHYPRPRGSDFYFWTLSYIPPAPSCLLTPLISSAPLTPLPCRMLISSASG